MAQDNMTAAAVEPAATPTPLTVTDAQALQFVYDGRQRLTDVAEALRALGQWAATFEQRGGAEIYGNDALEMVYFYNDFQALMNATRQATVARLRTDI